MISVTINSRLNLLGADFKTGLTEHTKRYIPYIKKKRVGKDIFTMDSAGGAEAPRAPPPKSATALPYMTYCCTVFAFVFFNNSQTLLFAVAMNK